VHRLVADFEILGRGEQQVLSFYHGLP
jgi:hypothetical protein